MIYENFVSPRIRDIYIRLRKNVKFAVDAQRADFIKLSNFLQLFHLPKYYYIFDNNVSFHQF